MAEWSNAAVLKTAEPETVPGVRIPLLPPFSLDWNKKRARSTRLRALKRLGRRSPHARSRMPAFGACIAADSPTPFEEVCLHFGLMTGPSNQLWTETILRKGFWATSALHEEWLRLLGYSLVTFWIVATSTQARVWQARLVLSSIRVSPHTSQVIWGNYIAV